MSEYTEQEYFAFGIIILDRELKRIERHLMASIQEVKDQVTALDNSVGALEAAEAAEGPALGAGEVAVQQSDLDALQAALAADQARIDALTNAKPAV